jgi:hypothetical protein
MALGFAVATLKTSLIDHPVLRFSTSGVTITGFVELREESQHTDRFVLRVDRIEGGRMEVKPERVRLSVKRGMAPPAGSPQRCHAAQAPALGPLPGQGHHHGAGHGVGRVDAPVRARFSALSFRATARPQRAEGGALC